MILMLVQLISTLAALSTKPLDKVEQMTTERLKSVFAVLALAFAVTAISATLAFNAGVPVYHSCIITPTGYPAVLFMAEQTLGGFGILLVSLLPSISTLYLTMAVDGRNVG